jgi:hypothetical protein
VSFVSDVLKVCDDDNLLRICVENPEERRRSPLGKLRREWLDNIKTDLKYGMGPDFPVP